ncbi:hypothetical protein [Rhizobium leguminosarum]
MSATPIHLDENAFDAARIAFHRTHLAEYGSLRAAIVAYISASQPQAMPQREEDEQLAEINAALKTINDTCIALQYDDRGRYGVETIKPLRDVVKLINKLVMREILSLELLEVVKAFVVETIDYATINKLGDAEQQHNVKWARSVIAKIEGQS